MKYIVVTGGVLSGIGKGITASSIGLLLKSCGYKLTAIKIDPYLNCDAGTMNPFQHGEVYVLDDGGEVDLDLGNYERFLDISLSRDHNITTGKAYRTVIERERRGDYLGKTVQIIPHVTDEIRETIKRVAQESGAEITIIELGGTVGDMESMPFLEALRQLHSEVGSENLIFVHTTLIPVVGAVGEQKTKPTQHSVKELMSLGIRPDVIVCRGTYPLSKSSREKISLFCSVHVDAVISIHDISNTYSVPIMLHEQGITDFILGAFDLWGKPINLDSWNQFIKKTETASTEVTVAMVGKYIDLKDAYLSYIKAFQHSGAELAAKVHIKWLEAEKLEGDESVVEHELGDVDGIVVPGGFGSRGVEGKMRAIKYARENKIPFLGVCLGFQLATVEFCRNRLGMAGANSTEFDEKTKYPAIYIMPEQKNISNLGGTMRLGAMPVVVKKGSIAYSLYKSTDIQERHRHRYEVNPEYIEKIEKAGWRFTGKSKDGTRMEIAELDGHPYFVASQFHPELKSRPNRPAPLFYGLTRACAEHARSKKK